MIAISTWAKANPAKARAIIGLSHFMAVVNAIFLGCLLFLHNFAVSFGGIWWLAQLFFVAYLLYPIKGRAYGFFKHSYIRQKTLDTFYTVAYSLGIALTVVYACNYIAADAPQASSPFRTVALENPKEGLREQASDWKAKIRAEIKALKKQAKAQDKAEPGTIAKRVALIILTVAAILFLGALVGGLACSLSCSGQEALAVFVILAGWGGLVWLGIVLIKLIVTKVGVGKSAPATPES